ncbi:response regulator transcription factor [Oscillibacter sp.]|uniref:response regulator transcription factor n=1 Tax=Oscillibacter sp. TaxID=1945593 RepID=UPI00289702BB|nr:response regulator transcription factor [Oscillibacter sp.]
MTTVLVVEDDRGTRILTCSKLKGRYTVLSAQDGIEALDVLENKHVDLAIVDVMMRRMDGYELVRQLRADGNTLPVLMLTARQEFNDKRLGFSSGTDDYMTKPIQYEELFWRVESLLRRAGIASRNEMQIGKTILDERTYMLTREKEKVEFPKKEFELLYKLLSYPGQIFTKSQLLDDIWGFDSASGEETIKTHISRLRNKCRDIPEFRIVTRKGLGYKAEIVKDF